MSEHETKLIDLVMAQNEYIAYLARHSEKTAMFLHIHHMTISQEEFAKGEAHRKRLAELGDAVNIALYPVSEEKNEIHN